MNDVPEHLAQGLINEEQRSDLQKALEEIAEAEKAQKAAHQRTMTALSATRNLLTHVLASESEQSEYERARYQLWEAVRGLRKETHYGHSTGWKDVQSVCYDQEEYMPFLQFLEELERTGCSDEVIKKVPHHLTWFRANMINDRHRGSGFDRVLDDISKSMKTIRALLR